MPVGTDQEDTGRHGTPHGDTGRSTAPALTPPRWPGRKPAVAAALAVTREAAAGIHTG